MTPADPGPQWELTPHWATAVVLGMTLLVVGLVLGRAELVVLASPLIVCTAAALLAPRPAAVTAVLDDDGGSPQGPQARFALDLRAHAQLGVFTVDDGLTGPWSILLTGSEHTAAGTLPAVVAALPLSGRRELFSWQLSGLAADGCLAQRSRTSSSPVQVSILPAVTPVSGGPLPQRLHGLTGSHGSRTPGAGSDFRDIHLFTTGDSLRRIDWRATARKGYEGQPYVRRTFATAEAAVTLVVDANDDLVARTDAWLSRIPRAPTEVSSLHLLREAATAVAAGYLGQGDRVGLSELVSYRRGLRAAPGQRQLDHIRLRLTGLRAAVKVPTPAQDLELVPGCVAIVFSTFMADDAARMMTVWQRLGHQVLGVDVLPWLTDLPVDPVQRLAVRMVLAKRKAALRQLREAGLPVLAWRGPVPPGDVLDLDSPADVLPLAAGLALLQARRGGRVR